MSFLVVVAAHVEEDEDEEDEEERLRKRPLPPPSSLSWLTKRITCFTDVGKGVPDGVRRNPDDDDEERSFPGADNRRCPS